MWHKWTVASNEYEYISEMIRNVVVTANEQRWKELDHKNTVVFRNRVQIIRDYIKLW